jgi:hypothetical protein
MHALRDRLLASSFGPAPGLRSIGYTTHAEAEGELAWLNAEVTVRASLVWADESEHTTSTVDSLRSFSSPPPRPTHRLAGS